MLQEGREIRPRSQRPDSEVGLGSDLAPLVCRGRVGDGAQSCALPDAEPSLGIFDIARDIVDELLQRVRSGHAEEATTIRIRIQVRHGLFPELVCVRLDPLRGAEQRGLFTVPGGVDDGTARLPPLFEQLAVGAGLLQQRGLSGNGVLGAVHPGIVMIAADHPLIRCRAAGDPRNHIAQRF